MWVFQRQESFNGKVLQQQGYQRYESSTAWISTVSIFNGMDFFTAGILGLFLSTVGIFHRLGFGDGRPYFYDLLLARVILDGVYQ